MLNTHFDPFPILTTDRLILRGLNLNDAEAMFSMRSDPEMMAYIPRPLSKSVEDAAALIQTMLDGNEKKESLIWAISLKNDPKLIGTIGFWRLKPEHFRAEVGYLLHRDFWQKGIMYEALQFVLEFGFKDMNCHSIEAVIDPENVASERLLQKCGFVKEAHFKENCFWNGRFLDSIIYSKLKTM
jgi:[ribosomal protein S5]-alanine N-acetyltransferase